MIVSDLLPLDDGWYSLVAKNGKDFKYLGAYGGYYPAVSIYVKDCKIISARGRFDDKSPPIGMEFDEAYLKGWRASFPESLESLLIDAHSDKIHPPELDEWADEYEILL